MTSREEREKQFEQFCAEVSEHRVQVLRDDGLYRHLRCSRGGYAYSFDVITWPGYLCYAGDMGCFVFTRLRDMFEFFRGRRTALVDRGYLAEKAVAADKADGIKEYSEELFEAAVRDDFHRFTGEWDESARTALWREVEDDVLVAACDGIGAAIQAASAFTHKGRQVFPDFWEHRLEDYTARFRWCCYAVPWAIEQYDGIRRDATPATVEAS